MHVLISKYGIFSKILMAVLLYIIWQFAMWGLTCDRPGDEIAMVLGAAFTPMIGLFKFVLEFADRKSER